MIFNNKNTNKDPVNYRFKIHCVPRCGYGITYVIVDKETGVNYLAYEGYEGVGLTVLVDADGKPVVTKE